MNELLNEFKSYLSSLVRKYKPSQSSGTISGLAKKMEELSESLPKYHKESTAKANQILAKAGDDIDKKKLQSELLKLIQEYHNQLMK